MTITIQTIHHLDQRYNTCGDWQYDKDGNLTIRVSEMLINKGGELAVAIHELVEAVLCRRYGVTEESIDKFDMSYQGDGEPGDDPKAPYNHQHCVATAVERIVISDLFMNWQDYEDEIIAMTIAYEAQKGEDKNGDEEDK